MPCYVSCNFRCKVLVLSRYCTVDGTFLCLLYVSNVQKKVYCQFIYCFGIMCILIYCKCFDNNKHAVLVISVTFRGWGGESPLFYIKMCHEHNVNFFLSLLYAFLWFWKAWKSLNSYLYVWNTISIASNVKKSIHSLLHSCVGVQWHAVGFNWLILGTMGKIWPLTFFFSSTVHS